MAVYNGVMYIAYVANNGCSGTSCALYVTGSSNGSTWSTPVVWTGAESGSSPSLVVWNNELWVAYLADGSDGPLGALYLTYATNPAIGPQHAPIQLTTSSQYVSSSPTAFVGNNQLAVAVVDNFRSTLTSIDTYVSSNGSTFVVGGWCNNDPTGDMPQVGAVLGVVEFNSNVYYSYQTQGGAGGHYLRVCQTNFTQTGATQSFFSPGYEVGSGVNATVWGANLILSFKDYNSHDLVLEGSKNGQSYSPAPYSTDLINGNNQMTPGTVSFNGTFYAAFTQNDGSHYMNVTHSE